jgi:nitrate reductase beta subunit
MVTKEPAMDVRAQIATLFHLDKCLGCHTCSVACKNVWTDRRGAEYMWWNNVETKPGTGFPTRWEDQESYAGGWERHNGGIRLRATDRARIVPNIFHHPHMPTMDDYYEPWTYDYRHLFNAPLGHDQPSARPISLATGKPLEIESGPNWDDDLGGSPVYAENDPNLAALSEDERRQLFAVERLVFFYLPRICNHCLNPACVAGCPSAALYKRGEDGVVLGAQDRCRAWRACVAACPYKKTFYNWETGKSEKCILCFPRLETGQAPGCFHTCVGRIRYAGVVLYDASRIAEVAMLPDDQLIEGQRSLILDPRDPTVVEAARRGGVPQTTIDAAERSPVFPFVKTWKLALPLHIEWRTLPMLFYVPPMSPVMSQSGRTGSVFADIDSARVPLAYLAKLFGAGSPEPVRYALRKQAVVRWHRRRVTVGDIDEADLQKALADADCSETEAEAIYKLTALCAPEDRFVLPAAHREETIQALDDPLGHKGSAGFGFLHHHDRRG